MKVIELYCEKCGHPMDFTGEVVIGINKHFRHRCPKCGHVQDSCFAFPFISREEKK